MCNEEGDVDSPCSITGLLPQSLRLLTMVQSGPLGHTIIDESFPVAKPALRAAWVGLISQRRRTVYVLSLSMWPSVRPLAGHKYS